MPVPVVPGEPADCPCCDAHGHHHRTFAKPGVQGGKVGDEFPCLYCAGYPRVACRDCRKKR